MSFRDPLEAAHARIAALEVELALLRERRGAERRAEQRREGAALRAEAEAARLAAEAEAARARAEAEAARARATAQLEVEQARMRAALGHARAEQELERRRLEAELAARAAQAQRAAQRNAEQLRALNEELEALLTFDRAVAAAFYHARATALRAALADAERGIASAEQRRAAPPIPAAAGAEQVAVAAARREAERLRAEAMIRALVEHREALQQQLAQAEERLLRVTAPRSGAPQSV